MNLRLDPETGWLVGGTIGLLALATVVGRVLARRTQDDRQRRVVDNLNARIGAWWIMVLVFALAMGTGGTGTVILFCLVSFLALREAITLSPTHRGDHRTLFWLFFIITPLHYWLVATARYGLFTVLLPVYAFLFVPLRSVLFGDCARFLERTAKIQWAMMTCVYCVSHAPALLFLDIPNYEGQNGKLLFFFVTIVQLSDVLQYVWGKTLGRHKIAPMVSPNKTWEGFLGGVGTTTAIGAALWWATPFSPAQSAAMSLVVCLMGFAGGLVMSAIKRDLGVKDWGTLIEGHGGIMDRIDSLCFAAPVFFHMTRFWFTP